MIKYDTGTGEFKNWIISETVYDENHLGKTEAIFLIGNGYLGIRSANEEETANTTRNTFISGTFNKANELEVTELPNIFDIYELNLKVDGKKLVINNYTVKQYSKTLNIKTGELCREMLIKNDDLEVQILTSRFVSLDNLHLTAQTFEIKCNKDVALEFVSWINGQVSNSGEQHFLEGEKRLIDKEVLQYVAKTNQSDIFVSTNVVHKFNKDMEELILMDRRKIGMRYRYNLKKDETLKMTKYGVFTTSIDKTNTDDYNFKQRGLNMLEEVMIRSYDDILNESKKIWEKYWENVNIEIEGDDFSQIAIRYAQYQLLVNCPKHDERMNIGAKGLSGEGYKGHTFWDTELFMLPYFIFTQPKVARSLIKYRYLGLEGARKKALENNYLGAMYPWEAAWPSDGEVTPVNGAADIITGKATKIWSGFIEQHITADVVYALWLYYNITDDQEFMNKYGYEMVFDTANYWVSRVQKDKKGYVINNVIGPDEYKEHVNNNAFTNYMAKWNIDLAIDYLESIDRSILDNLATKISIKKDQWEDVSANIYLPQVNEDNILPQDDTYLTLKQIDLTKYKNQTHVGSMFEDYSLSEVNKIQVSKQADVMILFLLMEGFFSKEVKKANWDYYEPKTLHDSSLSLSTHVVLAQDLGDVNISEELFKRACNIDIGPNMKTSDHGIHTASLGGIWQGVVYGYGGVRFKNDILNIDPKIHTNWKTLKFPIIYKGNKLMISINEKNFTVENLGNKIVTFVSGGDKYEVIENSTLEIEL